MAAQVEQRFKASPKAGLRGPDIPAVRKELLFVVKREGSYFGQ